MGAIASAVGPLPACWWWPLARTSSAWTVYPWTGLLALPAAKPTRCSRCQTLPGWRTTLTPNGMCQWMSSSGSAPTLRRYVFIVHISGCVCVCVTVCLCLPWCLCLILHLCLGLGSLWFTQTIPSIITRMNQSVCIRPIQCDSLFIC